MEGKMEGGRSQLSAFSLAMCLDLPAPEAPPPSPMPSVRHWVKMNIKGKVKHWCALYPLHLILV